MDDSLSWLLVKPNRLSNDATKSLPFLLGNLLGLDISPIARGPPGEHRIFIFEAMFVHDERRDVQIVDRGVAAPNVQVRCATEKLRAAAPWKSCGIQKRRTNMDKEIIRTDAIVLSKFISEHIFHDSNQVVEPKVWGNVFMEVVSPANKKFGSLKDHHLRMTYFA